MKYYQCPACLELSSLTQGRICLSCDSTSSRIKQQNRIAERAGTPHDLTVYQWMETIRCFKGKCAYCSNVPAYMFIEHFIPVSLGGGTTISNCIPACHICNTRKRNLHPDQVKLIPQEALERVRVFLNRLKS